jgi:hypothetical protein
MFTTLFHWLGRTFPRSRAGRARRQPHRPPAASRRAFVPCLDVLEDRTLPSTAPVLHLACSPGPLKAAANLVNANPGGTAQAGQQFAGSAVSEATSVTVGDCFDEVKYAVVGSASAVGRFTGVGHQRVSYCGGPDLEGELTLTDANGDQLNLSYAAARQGTSCYVGSITIMGGTGAYYGATGSAALTVKNYSPDRPFDAFFDGALLLQCNVPRASADA